ncbi:MAG: hypothetical protein HUU25_09430 [Candidatus Sumerlaeia bacterium]|nr:hypothetical protein [Candidatus Sumerlaeia bacterium]
MRRSIATVLLLAVVPQLGALWGEFIQDDILILLRSPIVTGERPAWHAFTTGYWEFFPADTPELYRPLPVFAFALEWRLWGEAPVAFRAINLACHALVSLLVLGVFRRIARDPGVALAGAALFAAGCDPCFFVTLEDLTASASQDVKGKVRIDAQVSYVWFENFCTAEEAGKTIRFDFAHLGPVEPTRYADGSMDTTRFANGSVQQGKVIATSSFAKLETLVSYTVDNPPPPSLPPGTLAGMSGPPTDPLNQFDPGDFPLDPPPVMPGGLPSGPCPGCDPPDPPEPKCPDNDCRGSMPPWRINASNDVDLASGALTFEEFDAVIEEPGQDFTHLLSYSSADRERVGPFGRGFHYAYDRRVEAFQSAMVVPPAEILRVA